MADFLDFDSLEMNVDEQVNGAKEHPLKGMKTGAKMAYVGGLLFACHADDNTLQKEERSLVMGVARSLGLGKEEVDDLAEMVVGLTDKIAYLKEIVATLKDRKTIIFFLFDIAKAMSADGGLNENAMKLIGAIQRLAHLDEKDIAIVTSLIDVTKVDSSNINYEEVLEDEVFKSLLQWHVPQMFDSKTGELNLQFLEEACQDAGTTRSFDAASQASSEVSQVASISEGKTDKSSSISAIDKMATDDFLKRKMCETKVQWLDSVVKLVFAELMTCGLSSMWYCCIPEKKKYNAHISMMVKEDEHIVQIDCTVFGSNKEGLVITNKALYYKNSFEVPHRIELKNLKTCTRDGMYLDLGEHGRFCCIPGEESAELFCRLMVKLIEKIQENPHMLEV